MKQSKKRLGELLLERGLIKAEDLETALAAQKKNGQKLGEIVINFGYVAADKILELLALQSGFGKISLAQHGVEQGAACLIPVSLAKRHNLIPFALKGEKLCLAMSDPTDFFALDDVRMASGYEVKAFLALEEDVAIAINKSYGVSDLVEKAVDSLPAVAGSVVHESEEGDTEAPIIGIVDSLIRQAVKEKASDIHVESLGLQIRIRYRVDGVLRDVMTFPQHLHAALLSRIKVISGLNIAERRVPQDGRLVFKLRERAVDVRVSILPTIRGEKAVLRILDRSLSMFRVDELGFSPENLLKYRSLYENSCGMILVTGPTGSGKTTTLYATLSELNDAGNNIVTVEDPVEYLLQGVNQVQVNTKVGVTFASALRSILRQDPNIIMLGEVRDAETADIAIRAALTGHLVISTLHTNDAAGAIIRLLEMGIEPFLIASAVKGVVAQRLVRTLCRDCSRFEPVSVTLGAAEELFLRKLGASGRTFSQVCGCAQCNQGGYKGRMAIQEVLLVDSEVRSEICGACSAYEIAAKSAGRGMKTMAQDGVMKAQKGLTTLTEVMKATYF